MVRMFLLHTFYEHRYCWNTTTCHRTKFIHFIAVPLHLLRHWYFAPWCIWYFVNVEILNIHAENVYNNEKCAPVQCTTIYFREWKNNIFIISHFSSPILFHSLAEMLWGRTTKTRCFFSHTITKENSDLSSWVSWDFYGGLNATTLSRIVH